MDIRRIWDKYGNCIAAVLTILVNIILLSVCFDFYYDLNDDVMMKDVMAGVYAGVPDGHNMQTLYPLGAFISVCYRIIRGLPWYGSFLCLCQFISLFLIGHRLLKLSEKLLVKLGCMVLLTLYIWGVLLPHMVALQYTVTTSMLAGAAVFLFLTSDQKAVSGIKAIGNTAVAEIFLVLLAYNLRSEMLLLVFPLIALAGLFRWIEEEKFFTRENYIKYGAVIGCILAGMLICKLIDAAAYSGEGWHEAVEFFDKRTEVYDFHYDILTSGDHSEQLAGLGVSEAQQELLADYNFGLDEDIDETMMGRIADYAETVSAYEGSDNIVYGAARRVLDKMPDYVYRTLHSGDAPYNVLVLFGYMCVFVCGLTGALRVGKGKVRGRWNFIWQLILSGVFRSVLWMYIMLNGREPDRIIHSLYMVEAALLYGWLCLLVKKYGRMTYTKKHNEIKVITTAMFALFGLICLINVPASVKNVRADMQARDKANTGALAISEYCREHSGNFYFEDVYSTVSFSQKIFENVDNSLTNYEIMGGWMCKTPLYDKKLEQFGMTDTQEGLLRNEGAYLITESDGMDWLVDFYAYKGYSVSVEKTDMIDDKYTVYRIKED